MPGSGIRLVVGLGNPGRRYEGTRHNVGFLAVDRFLADAGGRWGRSPVGEGLAADLGRPAGRVWVVKPHTFMNASGEMVAEFSRYYKVPSSDILVVSDDFQLPLGRLRLRARGSAGGQKGLDSVLALLGTQEVPRMRLGIGPLPERWDPVDFVLGSFGPAEREELERMIEKASAALGAVLDEGLEPAMNAFNRGEE
jgi:PTH1 family peptidyl-tRNA hydrolase